MNSINCALYLGETDNICTKIVHKGLEAFLWHLKLYFTRSIFLGGYFLLGIKVKLPEQCRLSA